MWEALLTGLFEARNKSRLRLRLLLCDTFAVIHHEYKSVTEKTRILINLNAEFPLQKPELKFHSNYQMMMYVQYSRYATQIQCVT